MQGDDAPLLRKTDATGFPATSGQKYSDFVLQLQLRFCNYNFVLAITTSFWQLQLRFGNCNFVLSTCNSVLSNCNFILVITTYYFGNYNLLFWHCRFSEHLPCVPFLTCLVLISLATTTKNSPNHPNSREDATASVANVEDQIIRLSMLHRNMLHWSRLIP